MPAICFDIDNVLARTDEVMRRVICEFSKASVNLAYEDVVCFDYWLCRDEMGRRIVKDEWPAIHEEFTRNHLLAIRPFDDAKSALEEIGETFDVHLSTSRLPEGRDATVAWLSKHGIPYCSLHWAEHGEKHLISQAFVAAVEDDREQGYAFHAMGVAAFLLAHPWNRIGAHSPLRRVADWGVLKTEILNLAG